MHIEAKLGQTLQSIHRNRNSIPRGLRKRTLPRFARAPHHIESLYHDHGRFFHGIYIGKYHSDMLNFLCIISPDMLPWHDVPRIVVKKESHDVMDSC